MTELAFMTITEAASRIATRDLSPVELTDALIKRAEALDPQINAYLLPTFEDARAPLPRMWLPLRSLKNL